MSASDVRLRLPTTTLVFSCNLSSSRAYTGCNSQTPNERNKPMNKNINNVVELTEKELAGVVGGGALGVTDGKRVLELPERIRVRFTKYGR